MNNAALATRGPSQDSIQDHIQTADYTSEVEKVLESCDHDQALNIYKKEYKMSVSTEQKSNILLKIALIFEKSNQFEFAMKTYEKCLKLGVNTKAFVKLGDLQILRGDIELGIDNLEKAVCILRSD